jgi:ABC-type branched-subunit amino acid transport system ATPase component
LHPLLDVHEITVQFGGVHAVTNVSFTIPGPGVFGLAGPNGSGKTTTLNVVSRVTKPQSGALLLNGEDYSRVPTHRLVGLGIARTFQNIRLVPDLTVLENVMVGLHQPSRSLSVWKQWLQLHSARETERWVRERAQEVLQELGVEELAGRRPTELPYGLQRRIEIARAIVSNPRLLLLDEPTAGMAGPDVDVIERLIRNLAAKRRMAVLVVEHNVPLLAALCERLTVMISGRILLEGEPRTVLKDEEVVEAYLGRGASSRRGTREAQPHHYASRGRSIGPRPPLAPGPALPNPAVTTPDGVREAILPKSSESDSSGQLLRVRDMWVSYGSIEAVRGVTLSVREGWVVALLGANGAGKSTTLKAVSGLLPKRRGQIYLSGTDITRSAPHVIATSGLTHIPEGRQVFGPLTVSENLDLGAYYRRDRDVARDLDAVFDLFPALAQRRKQAAGSLSGGEQQMLAFGRALMAHPRLILMDEPSMGLSPIATDTVYDAVRSIHQTGVAILLVEQSAERALDVADYAYVMQQGAILLEGPPKDIRHHPEFVSAYLGGASRPESAAEDMLAT